jgi:hypothetical protein
MTPLIVSDAVGPKTLTLDQAQAFHAGRHGPGVTLAWRFLALAFDRLGLEAPDRTALAVDLSVAPPGITDAVEFVTRAVTRRRLRVRPHPEGGIRLALEVGGARIESRVRPDVLPEGFATAQRRDEADLLSEAEHTALLDRRARLDADILAADPETLFETTVHGDPGRRPARTSEAPPVLTDPAALVLSDHAGAVRITLEDALAYHDRDHFAGVVLAHKILRFVLADRETTGGTIPARDTILVMAGLNPPGLLDGFEVATRALSRQRFMRRGDLDAAPRSPFGHFAFDIRVGSERHALRLRDGLLPADFADLGTRAEAGAVSSEEAARWDTYKRDIATALMPLDPTEVLETMPINA